MFFSILAFQLTNDGDVVVGTLYKKSVIEIFLLSFISQNASDCPEIRLTKRYCSKVMFEQMHQTSIVLTYLNKCSLTLKV